MKAIFYLGQESGCWTVRRFGRPVTYEREPEEAIAVGRDLAASAASRGWAAELRIRQPLNGGPDAPYVTAAEFTP